MEYLLFLIGLALVIKGGDFFVDSSVDIAKKFHISEIIIGATIVSIGTTLSEVMVSTSSALKGLPSVSYGNAIGSIICNTALICAISIIFKPTDVDKKSLIIPTIFFFVSVLIYVFNAYVFRYFSRFLGYILLLIFAVYMYRNIISTKAEKIEVSKITNEENVTQQKILIDITILILSAMAIAVGANLMVDNGVLIARDFNVPETVIALTMIAIGTSLPELATAINSLIKGHSSLSLGNIIGANLFNIILVSGLSISLSPFELPAGKLINGQPSSLIVDIPIMFIVMLILTIPSIVKGKLERWQGIVLIIIYSFYLVFQFVF